MIKGSRRRWGGLIRQFIKFGIVGVSNTIISLAVYYICIYLGMHYLLANLMGFIISVLNAYYWNSRYVFKTNKGNRKETKSFFKVLISYGSTLMLGTILLALWVDILHMSDVIAPLINLCITIPINFFMNKFWALKGEESCR